MAVKHVLKRGKISRMQRANCGDVWVARRAAGSWQPHPSANGTAAVPMGVLLGMIQNEPPAPPVPAVVVVPAVPAVEDPPTLPMPPWLGGAVNGNPWAKMRENPK